MSAHAVRCTHCGATHDATVLICPTTGRSLRTATPSAATLVPSQLAPLPPPPPPQRKPPPLPARPNPVVSSSPPRAVSSIPAPPSASPHSVGTVAHPGVERELIGQLIDGKYLIRGVLGEGGMGTVYEAENRALRRSVAVKVLHPSQARKKVAVKRFQQEARAAGAIGHPNICEVYDLGTLEGGSPYLVMEHLQGETLADRIAGEGGLPFDDLLDIVSQVLAGLVAAHAKGIVHRDIKPENVFLIKRPGVEAGTPIAKVLDFGVSKVMPMNGAGGDGDEELLNLTRTGMVMGTPYYMSPEQARGDRNLDGRVDIWACGIILYEGLTGRRPFTAANYNALLLQILTTNPRPARELRPALPPGFDSVMNRAMARAREERYQTAEEFHAALRMLRDRRSASAPMFAAPRVTTPSGGSSASNSTFGQRRDPLASLPRLPTSEAPVQRPLHTPNASKTKNIGPESSTHIALHASQLDSGEASVPAGAALVPLGPGSPHDFDDIATEIHKPDHMVPPSLSTDWDDVTTRLDPRRQIPPMPPPSAEKLSVRRAPPKPAPKAPSNAAAARPPANNFEDTVKIEGDLEAHFAEEIRKSKES